MKKQYVSISIQFVAITLVDVIAASDQVGLVDDQGGGLTVGWLEE